MLTASSAAAAAAANSIGAANQTNTFERSNQEKYSQIEPGSQEAPKKTGGLRGAWLDNAFLIITLTKKFINNIKELSMKYKFAKLKQSQFVLIDDVATDYPYFQVRSFFKNDQPSLLDSLF